MDFAKTVNANDVARHADVSVGTVDRALHGRKGINAKTRERVLRIARELGYEANLAARLLALGRAPLCVGICIPNQVGYSMHYDPFYDQVREGILEEVRRFKSIGASVLDRPVRRLGVGETARVRELLDNDIRALILAPGNPRRLAPLIEEAESRKVAVLCVSSDAPQTARSTVICVDPESHGRCAAELMGRFVPQNSKVAIVTGMVQVEDHRRKIKGFSEAFPRFCKGGKIVEVIENHEDEKEAFRKCVSLFRRFPSIDGLYLGMGLCLPVCAALDGAGLSGKVRFIATDLYVEMVPHFRRGTIFASIHQQPYVQGQVAMRLALDHIVNNVPLPSSFYLNPQIVLQSNLSHFREISHPKAFKWSEASVEPAIPITTTPGKVKDWKAP